MLARWETEMSVWVLVRRSCHCCELKGRVEPQPEDAILWPIKQTNSQLTQCCLPSFLYQLSISILSLASALTPTQVRRSQFREVTCLEANPTAVKRKKRKKEAKQKKKNFQPDLLQGAIHRMITLGLVPAQWRRWKHRARGNRGDDKAAQT